MLLTPIKKYEGVLYPYEIVGNANLTLNYSSSDNFISNDPVRAKVMIGMAVSLISGIIQVLFAILHVGFVAKYLSDSIVTGFTCGSAYHVVVSQISAILGIRPSDTTLAFVLVGVITNVACFTRSIQINT